MAKVITDSVLGTLMNITNKYEYWNKGDVTTKIAITSSKRRKNKKSPPTGNKELPNKKHSDKE